MKLRILDDSVRLRLTRPEVDRFAQKGVVAARTRFGDGRSLIYELRRAEEGDALFARWEDATLTVFMAARLADEWTASGVDDGPVGVQAEQPLGDDAVLEILVEKDFKCLSDERDPANEAEAYPHPKENDLTC